ncbi:MAG: hypothetical protein ACKO2G_15665 [Verrucomicrobiales bacterium]
MKNSFLLVHAVWGVLAVGAFAGGLHFGQSKQAVGAPATSTRIETTNGTSPWKAGDGKSSVAAPVPAQPSATVLGELPAGPLGSEAMRATVAAIMREIDPIKRNRLFAELLEKLNPENIEAAVEAMREGGLDPSNYRDMGLLTYSWGKMDPEKAMAYASEIGGRGQSFVTSSVLAGWASQDPKTAMEWFRTRDASGFDKNIMARGLFEGIVQKDVAMASEMAAAETDSELKGQFYDAIGRQQMKDVGLDATRKWLDDMISSGNVEPGLLAGTVEQVAGQMANKNPKDAIEWAMALPQGRAQENALEEGIQAWARVDPTATSAYLAAMPASEAKDGAVQDFARIIVREDPKSAVTWAASINDPERRERAMVRTAQEWHRQDAAAANAWAQSSGLSEEAVQSIANPPEWDRGRGGPPGGGRRGF